MCDVTSSMGRISSHFTSWNLVLTFVFGGHKLNGLTSNPARKGDAVKHHTSWLRGARRVLALR